MDRVSCLSSTARLRRTALIAYTSLNITLCRRYKMKDYLSFYQIKRNVTGKRVSGSRSPHLITLTRILWEKAPCSATLGIL